MHGSTRRVLVAGHLHLDAPLRGLPTATKDLFETVRDATQAALEHLVESALEHSVQALLLTGAVLGPQPSLRACAAFRDGMEALIEEGIEVAWAVQSPREQQLLQELECLPQGLRLLIPQTPHCSFFESHNTQSATGLITCDLIDAQTLPPQEWAWTAEQTWGRIGLTPRSMGHLVRDHQAQREEHFQVILSSESERVQTSRIARTVYHAPGCLQSLTPQVTGSCSATLLEFSASGEVELKTLETGIVRRETLELLIDPEETLEQLYERMELEFLELIPQLEGSPVRLLQLHWEIRGPHSQLKFWSSEELTEHISLQLSETEQAIPVLHEVRLAPQLQGAINSEQEFLDEHLEEQYLQKLGEKFPAVQLVGSSSPSPLAEQLMKGWKGKALPWSELWTEMDHKQISHRSAEFGLKSLQNFGKSNSAKAG